MKKKFFIAFEGLDGSGKSTQIKPLADKLKGQGFKIYTTAEPTKSRIGLLIKDIFNHKMEADHRTIAALYAADRLEHVLNKTDGILKKLDEGYTVISDRYYFSSYAYHGTHMDMDWVISANSLTADLLRPDLNIFIDVPIEVCIQRLNRGRSSAELYETEENLKNVREKYFEAFEKMKGKEEVLIIDGNRSAELIARDIWKEVSKKTELETKPQ
ncbi:MAG TPA: dTMP kinase [Chitinophagaceae bacterium]|jgi:dTMP kinase|nr:dTMP kinase [Chitinophagaceae bacterium]